MTDINGGTVQSVPFDDGVASQNTVILAQQELGESQELIHKSLDRRTFVGGVALALLGASTAYNFLGDYQWHGKGDTGTSAASVLGTRKVDPDLTKGDSGIPTSQAVINYVQETVNQTIIKGEPTSSLPATAITVIPGNTTLTALNAQEAIRQLDSKLEEAIRDIATKAELIHTHKISEIIGLQTDLNSKANILHTHEINEVVGLDSILLTKTNNNDIRLVDARTPTPHTHPLTDLQQSGALTGQVATWNGSAWIATTVSGTGDMTRVVYDTNTSGVVDDSERLGGQSPSFYASQTALTSGLATKENTLPTGTNLQYFKGDKTLGTLNVLAVAGLSTALAGKANTTHTHPLSEITQSSASTGQVPSWNGTAWVPSTPSTAPVTSVNGQVGVVTLNKTDVGLANADNTSDLTKPISTATQTALNFKENLTNKATDLTILNNTLYPTTLAVSNAISASTTPDATTLIKGKLQLAGDLGGTAALPTVPGLALKENTITSGTVSQYYRGDKTFQTLDKSTVGLSNVDNTTDLNKPISTATQTALNLKENLSNKAVDLTVVNNTLYPTTQAVVVALSSKASIIHTHPLSEITQSSATTGQVPSWNGTAWVPVAIPSAPVTSVNGQTGAVVLTKSDVGLSNVDNTADLNKPISTATQTALNLKVDTTTYTAGLALKSDKLTQIIAGSGLSGGGDLSADRTISLNTVSSAFISGAQAATVANDLIPSTLVAPSKTAVNSALTGKENTVSLGTVSQYYRGDKTFQTLDKSAIGLSNVDNTTDLAKPISTATQSVLNLKENLASKGVASGYAGLDASGIVPVSQLPVLGESNTASNQGSGSQIFKQKTGVDLELRTLTTGTGITAAQNPNDITLAVNEAALDLNNLGGILSVSKGGTGATTALGARTNLGTNDATNITTGILDVPRGGTGLGGVGANGTVLTVIAGAPAWTALPATTAWDKSGNASTTPATNFVGTTDAQDLVFRTNSIEKMRVLSAVDASNKIAEITGGDLVVNAKTIGEGNKTTNFGPNLAFGTSALALNTTGSRNTAIGEFALASNDSAFDNTAIGNGSLANNDGIRNTAVGSESMSLNTLGSDNTSLGYQSLQRNTIGIQNVALGIFALRDNVSGSNNTASGVESLTYNTTGFNNTASGASALRLNTTGEENVAIGAGALTSNTTANNNTAVGSVALALNTTGSNNTALGKSALNANTTGSNNNALGGFALFNNTTGSENIAIGGGALSSNTIGISNTAVGNDSLYSNVSGNNNTSVGRNALFNNTSGTDNNALGNQSLNNNTTGNNNTAFGSETLFENTTAEENAGFGNRALRDNTTGSYNTAAGSFALTLNTTGTNNSAFGQRALGQNTIGERNTGLGYHAGIEITTGNDNTTVGYGSGDNITTGSNNITLGERALVQNITGNNQIQIGNTLSGGAYITALSNGNVGLNTTTSTDTLEIKSSGANNSGLTFTNLTSASPSVTGAPVGVDLSGKLVRIAAGGTGDWSFAGNATTGTEFLGTTNAQDLSFRTNNIEKFRLDATAGVDNVIATINLGDLNVNGLIVGKGNIANPGNVIVSSGLPTTSSGFDNTAMGIFTLSNNTTGSQNTVSGYDALKQNTSGNTNSAFGHSALQNNTSGSLNTAIGSKALQNSTTSVLSTAVGYSALVNNTTGDENTAIGGGSMQSNTTGTKNVALGNDTLGTATTANENTAIGHLSQAGTTTGFNNTSVGSQSLFLNKTGNFNTAIGTESLKSNDTGTANVAIGANAMQSHLTSGFNVAVGSLAMQADTNGFENVAVGTTAMFSNTVGTGNTALGYAALNDNTTGLDNTALGQRSGFFVTGNRNITIGVGAGFVDNTLNDQLYIGSTAAPGGGAGTFLYGDNTGNLGIKTSTPTDTLEIKSPGANNSGLTFSNLTSASPAVAGAAVGVNASGKLVRIAASGGGGSGDWSYTGNATTGTEFLGTTNAQDLVFRTNGTEKSRILATVDTGNKISEITGGDLVVNALTIGKGKANLITNTVVGVDSLSNNTTGDDNTSIGHESLKFNTVGNYNTAVGSKSLNQNTDGFQNSALGVFSLEKNTNGSSNTALGFSALQENTVGFLNTAVGSSLQLNVTGNQNTAIGNALQQNNSGSGNIGIGTFVMPGNTTGNLNIAIGNSSLSSNNGDNNIALGHSALLQNGSSNRNIAIGTEALNSNNTGSDNTIVGHQALRNVTNGTSNVVLGSQAGSSQTSGDNNIIIGSNAEVISQTGSNQLQIGNWMRGDTAGQLGFNTTPTDRFEFNSSLFNDSGVKFTTFNSSTPATAGSPIGVDASGKLVRIALGAGSGDWSFTGNTLTGGEFLGSANAQDLVLKTNSNEVARFSVSPSGFNAIAQITGGDLVVNSVVVGRGNGNDVLNTAVGIGALNAITTGTENTAIGSNVMVNATTGGSNTGVGTNALSSLTTGFSNTVLGRGASSNLTSGDGNTTIGNLAGSAITTASSNTALGNTALRDANSSNNTAIGDEALQETTSGGENTAVGSQGLKFNTIGAGNIAVGARALRLNISGNNNVAVGNDSLAANTSGVTNNAFGFRALLENTTGSGNTGLGSDALAANTTGISNTGVGNLALLLNTTGSFNTAMGPGALNNSITGDNNTAIAPGTLTSLVTGRDNTALGIFALNLMTSGTDNTAVGANSFSGLTNGDFNVGIGRLSGASQDSGSNNIAIGEGSALPNITGSNQIRMGNTAITSADIQVAWNVTSDRRFKNTITNSDLGLDFVNKLRPVSYLRNRDDSGKLEYGLIAQELVATLEEVGAAQTGLVSTDSTGHHSVRYNDLFAPLIKAVQELSTENNTLKSELTEMRAEIAKLVK